MYSISLQEVFTVIAEEQAKKHFERFKFLTSANNFDVIFTNRVAANVASLNEFVGVLKPFKNYKGKVDLPNRLVILVDTMGADGRFTYFYLHNPETLSNEDFILTLTTEQREDCYVINEGKLQPFMVLGNEVLYVDLEDELEVEDIINIFKNQVAAKEKEIQKLNKKAKKLGEELKELSELIESMLK
jgi:hypothetical protein